MNDKEFREFHEVKYAELSDDIKQKAIAIIRKEIPQEVQKQIKQAILDNPAKWVIPYHFSWGMSVRNLLRTRGLMDVELPTGNWDDYYAMVVEEAVK